ncbi:hypothetical protein ACWDUN_15660 [Mycobacterium sp. NPDC003323]
MALRAAGVAFGMLALVAGGLQLWAYGDSGWVRHLILGLFAAAVGISVTAAALKRSRQPGGMPARRVR